MGGGINEKLTLCEIIKYMSAILINMMNFTSKKDEYVM